MEENKRKEFADRVCKYVGEYANEQYGDNLEGAGITYELVDEV